MLSRRREKLFPEKPQKLMYLLCLVDFSFYACFFFSTFHHTIPNYFSIITHTKPDPVVRFISLSKMKPTIAKIHKYTMDVHNIIKQCTHLNDNRRLRGERKRNETSPFRAQCSASITIYKYNAQIKWNLIKLDLYFWLDFVSLFSISIVIESQKSFILENDCSHCLIKHETSDLR